MALAPDSLSPPLQASPFAGGISDAWRAIGLAWRRFVLGTAVEQRIALEFGFDIGHQIEIGELQKLDRLHQVRRHHQRLALAD